MKFGYDSLNEKFLLHFFTRCQWNPVHALCALGCLVHRNVQIFEWLRRVHTTNYFSCLNAGMTHPYIVILFDFKVTGVICYFGIFKGVTHTLCKEPRSRF